MHGPSSHRWIHSAVRITFTIPASESPVNTRKLGHRRSDRRPKHVNTRAKAAMMIALDRHRKYVVQSQRYYRKRNAARERNTIRLSGSRSTLVSDHLQNAHRRTSPKKGNNKTKVSPRSSIKTQNMEAENLIQEKTNNKNFVEHVPQPHPLEILSGMIRLLRLDFRPINNLCQQPRNTDQHNTRT